MLVNQEKANEILVAKYKGYYLEEVNKVLLDEDYDSIATVKVWEDDDIFGAEATDILNWYKSVIDTNYAILNEVKAGTRAMPTKDEYLALLPIYGA